MQIKKLMVALTALTVLPLTACMGDKEEYTSSTDGKTKVKVDRDLTETNVNYTQQDGKTVQKEYDKNGNLINKDSDDEPVRAHAND